MTLTTAPSRYSRRGNVYTPLALQRAIASTVRDLRREAAYDREHMQALTEAVREISADYPLGGSVEPYDIDRETRL